MHPNHSLVIGGWATTLLYATYHCQLNASVDADLNAGVDILDSSIFLIHYSLEIFLMNLYLHVFVRANVVD